MRFLFVLAILFLLPGAEFAANAQDLTGQWTGASTNSLSEKKQKIVLNIASGDSVFAGVLHWYYPETQYFRNFIVRGQFHAKDSTLSIREDSLADRESEEGAEAGKGPYILYYRRSGHKEVLEGHWILPASAKPGNSDEPGQTLTIRLEKKAPAFIPLPPFPPHKKKDSAQQKQLTALNARETPLIMAVPVPVRQDSVKVELYDNGEIDGDSVSLFLNDELILTHLKLLAQSKTIWLHLDKSLPVNKLVLFAENLGTLPPNTALMEVTVKGKRYSIFLSTDFKKNAMVEFILQE
jgi:hypothetical protein